MFALRYTAIAILLAAAALGYFLVSTTGTGGRFDFKFGLDLQGGTQLTYRADTAALPPENIEDSLATLREVIERRVNAFGVGEPLVQTVQGGVLGDGEHRLIVELPGITDVNEAVRRIGETPLLEFKLVKTKFEADLLNPEAPLTPEAFETTGLTGEFLSRAVLEFGSGTGLGSAPLVRIDFDARGAELFADITRDNVGRSLAIFLDGDLVSAPTINEPITGGTAVISGVFTAEVARELVRNLNLGALPVPISLASSQTIGAVLGEQALRAGVFSSIVGFLALSAFMILWYRLPGLVAVVALVIYIFIMLALFKLIPVVLTAAGIAGFILSVGLAVDANVLIAERLKEELAAGKKAEDAIREGFSRAWLAIRDSNITHIIAAVILFWFGTSLIKGFALVLGVGVLVSMLSAITVSRTFLLALGVDAETRMGRFLLRSGLKI